MISSVVRNSLLSRSGIDKVLSLKRDDCGAAYLLETLMKFQDIKKFASEIHTEIHLIRPILKTLGYIYESKPKFHEDHVKGPDVALFVSEEERLKSSGTWGTKEYYDNTVGILQLKRYGANLHEGISGFYLDFENRMPVYQTLYLLKHSGTPWGILTNGKNWILVKKPSHAEVKLIEIDVEASFINGDNQAQHLFYQMFSCRGLHEVLPGIIENERHVLIDLLKTKKEEAETTLYRQREKAHVYSTITHIQESLLPVMPHPFTGSYLAEMGISIEHKGEQPNPMVNVSDASDIFEYLFEKKPWTGEYRLEHLAGPETGTMTKDDLLSLKILDMTPGFGTHSVRLIENLAYLSFTLPYKDKNTFVTEWESRDSLIQYIANNLLYGVVRSPFSLDVIYATMNGRFNSGARHFKPGNPLIGMSLDNISGLVDNKNQLGLFNKNPVEIIDSYRDQYKQFAKLSEKIREDEQLKNSMRPRLETLSGRIGDILDLMTAAYFDKSIDIKKIKDAVNSLEGSEATWERLRRLDWYVSSKQIAKRYGFFHFEIGFPFLLQDRFDLIFAAPAMHYTWEEEPPLFDSTVAFVKKGMSYLKDSGKLIVSLPVINDDLLTYLQKSKKYRMEPRNEYIVLEKRT